jgi:beta-mannosidase
VSESVWRMASTPAGAADAPGELVEDLDWVEVDVPGTVAGALDLPLDTTDDIEDRDWWWLGRVSVPEGRWVLELEGLATHCDVFVDGARIGRSTSMFVPFRVPVEGGQAVAVALAFRALTPALAARRPRPRWKTALVEQQNLRFERTSLLGRVAAWMPRLPVVGPSRAVALRPRLRVHGRLLEATEVDGVAHLRLRGKVDPDVIAMEIRLTGPGPDGAERAHALRVEPGPDGRVDVAAALPEAALWWPHTHGTPALHELEETLHTPTETVTRRYGAVGFRSVRVDRTDGGFRLRVNGRLVFCRGANWLPADPRTPDLDADAGLEALVAAGMNLVRVPGPTLWAPEALASAVRLEVLHGLKALQGNPAVVVICGGSEQEQQAAMLGLPAADWSHPFATRSLPHHAAAVLPGVPTVPNTPTGGALPFHTGEGLTHYYGVGAYRRPLSDARLAGVRFTPECLGFSHVPDEEACPRLPGGGIPAPHHPAWKAGVPRDSGAGWDFEDVRDHYLSTLLGEDAAALRMLDPSRYRALSRIVTGIVLQRVFAEWRRPGSPCGGALVWTMRDLRPGAGWGLLDHRSLPKAALRMLGRTLAARAVLLTDEGLDGARVHVHNEHPEALEGAVEVLLLRDGRTVVGEGTQAASLAPYTAVSLQVDALLGRFTDVSHAYRFGPPGHDTVLARLRGADGTLLHEDVWFPGGRLPAIHGDGGLTATLAADGDDLLLTVSADAVLVGVTVEAPGWVPGDDHLTLTPGAPQQVRLRKHADRARAKVHLSAVNAAGGVTVRA